MLRISGTRKFGILELVVENGKKPSPEEIRKYWGEGGVRCTWGVVRRNTMCDRYIGAQNRGTQGSQKGLELLDIQKTDFYKDPSSLVPN